MSDTMPSDEEKKFWKDMDEFKQSPEFTDTRREFMAKFGKLAVYTPPIVYALMNPTKALAASDGGG